MELAARINLDAIKVETAAKKPTTYTVYGPGKKPGQLVPKHKTTDLSEAKKHAEGLLAKHPDHAHHIHVDGGGRNHFVDTRTKKWTSLKN
jgi:hypothetical protein